MNNQNESHEVETKINSSTEKRTCPHCKEEINSGATRCPKCRGKIYVWTKGRIILAGLFIFSIYLLFTSISGQSPSSSSSLNTPADQIQNNNKESLPTSTPVSVITSQVKKVTQTIKPQTPISINWSSYLSIPKDFLKNPPYYIGTKVKLTGTVTDFLAAGDRGGDTNYISVISSDPSTPGQQFMLEIDSSINYQKVVSSVNKLNAVIAYGTIEKTTSFTKYSTNGTVIVPVININRLDGCNSILICTDDDKSLQTIFPAGIISKAVTPSNISVTQTSLTNPKLVVSCLASESPADINQKITWSTQISGGNGQYSYLWSGSDNLSGNSSAVDINYLTSGVKNASVKVTSGDQSITQNCINTVLVGEPKTWHSIFTYSGNTDVKTTSFKTVGDKWKITYSCSSIVESTRTSVLYGMVKPVSGYDSEVFASDVPCPTFNSISYAYDKKPGEYYLDMGPINSSYQVSVEDYY